jgi:hypothetical protein
VLVAGGGACAEVGADISAGIGGVGATA